MTRREEIELELQRLDKKIYALQATRDEMQKEYDSTPETMAGKGDVDDTFHERLKAFADSLGPNSIGLTQVGGYWQKSL